MSPTTDHTVSEPAWIKTRSQWEASCTCGEWAGVCINPTPSGAHTLQANAELHLRARGAA